MGDTIVRRLLGPAAGMVLILIVTASVALAGRPLVIAHRGAAHDAPENTLAAFRLAWERGADGIEGDFYLSKDGQVVCIHDKTTGRTAGKAHNLAVAASTSAELRRLDVGRWKDPKYAGERMPTLEEVLATVPPGKRIYIEVKCGPEIVPALGQVLQATGFPLEQARVIAFDADVIAAVKRDLPGLRAYWLTGYKKRNGGELAPDRESVRRTLEKIQADGLDSQANAAAVDRAWIEAMQESGLEFHVWTVNDPKEAARWADWGVDSITTDRPAVVLRALGGENGAKPAEPADSAENSPNREKSARPGR
jgi:glycerophosphoryl diester phosphodiesterase